MQSVKHGIRTWLPGAMALMLLSACLPAQVPLPPEVGPTLEPEEQVVFRVFFTSPDQVWHSLTRALEVLAIQSGEPGPIAQCLAGIDVALWDLAARVHGQPLYRYLGATEAVKRLAVYASGIDRRDIADRTADGATCNARQIGSTP